MDRIGVHIEDGNVVSVTSDGAQLVDAEVVIFRDGDPIKLVRVGEDFEGQIMTYLEDARSRSRLHLIGSACEIAGEALIELSRDDGESPDVMLRKIQAAMESLARALERAVGV